jgi:hypothetical protein
MKKLILLFAFSVFAFTLSFAQTKKIANESRSGKKTEFKIGPDSYRDGNFGLSPIMVAEMHHYSDSVRRVDSIKTANRKTDSVAKADSVQKAKQMSAPKKKSPKRKAKGISASIDTEHSKKTMMKP